MMAPIRLIHPSRRRLRVLLADDNRDSTDSLAELFRLHRCSVRTCYDGGAVLPVAEQFRPDVCVLDIRMPVLHGWAVAPLLRAWAGERALLLVALTGLAGRQQEAISLAAGFDHHIVKPDLQPLFECVAKFLERLESALFELSDDSLPRRTPASRSPFAEVR